MDLLWLTLLFLFAPQLELFTVGCCHFTLSLCRTPVYVLKTGMRQNNCEIPCLLLLACTSCPCFRDLSS